MLKLRTDAVTKQYLTLGFYPVWIPWYITFDWTSQLNALLFLGSLEHKLALTPAVSLDGTFLTEGS